MEAILNAMSLFENNQSEEALTLLKNYLPHASDEEKFSISELYMQWGFLAESNDILKELVHQYPDESELKVLLSQNYIELDDDKKAIDILNNIDKNDASYLQALLQLADLYHAEGLLEVAESKLLEAKKLDPKEIIIDFALGEFLFSTGDFHRSITFFEKVLRQHKEFANINITLRLAEAHAASGAYEKALEYYQKVRSTDPDTLFKHGFTAFHAKRQDIAIKVWEKLIEIDPYYHSVYYELAIAYRDEELIEKAFEICKDGLKYDEYNKELLFLTATLAYRLNNVSDSAKYVQQAIELDFDYREAVLFYVKLLVENDQFEDVIELLEKNISSGALDANYSWELAKAYYEEDLLDQSMESYEEAFNGLNDNPEFLKEYGYFLAELGNLIKAEKVLKKYLLLEPMDSEVEEYMIRLSETDDF